MLPSNSILHSRTRPGFGVAEAGLKDIVALGCVELRVIGVCHDAAVLTVVHLGRWTEKQRQKGKQDLNVTSTDLELLVWFLMFQYLFHLHPLASISCQWLP